MNGGRVVKRLLLVLLLLALLLPGAASAATVKVEAHGEGLLFRAAAGETNTVTIEVGQFGATVSDSTAALAAGAGCSSLDPHSARCTETGFIPHPADPGVFAISFSSVAATLGDGDDTLRAAFPEPPPGWTARCGCSSTVALAATCWTPRARSAAVRRGS